jgi:hypothetical protein
MSEFSEVGRGQRRPEQLDLTGSLLKFTLKHADARAPLVMLVWLDVETFGCCATRQFIHNSLHRIA